MHVFIINLLHATRYTRNWFADFSDHLFAGFIQADHRVFRVIREVVNLHGRYEGGVAFGRDLLR